MKNVNSDIAYEYIRKRILSGEFPPARALMTNALADEIGVSRTPVRDALRQLEVDGLVTIQARLGASVKTMDIREFREMCELRLALESHAAGLAARDHDELELREMRFAINTMRSLTDRIQAGGEEQPLLSELVREDVRFHVALMTAAKNDLMKSEILRLHLINRVVSGPTPGESNPQLDRARRDERRQLVLAEHEAIYRAVEQSDAPAAKAAMERHLQGIIDLNLVAMGRGSAGFLARQLTEEEMSYSA